MFTQTRDSLKVQQGLPRFTLHHFRRTPRTDVAALGVEPRSRHRRLRTLDNY